MSVAAALPAQAPASRDPNPTGVNAFNGISDESKAAPLFERLWQGGALDSQDAQEAAQLVAERAAQAPPREAPQARQEVPAEAHAAETTQTTRREEGPEFADLEDFLGQAGIERESFLTLPVKLRVDGAEESVPLAELVKGAQLERHFTKKSQGLAEAQRAFDAERTQATQAITQHLQNAQTLAQLAQRELMQEFQAVNWSELQAQDPGRWAAVRQMFNERAGAINQHLQQIEAQRAQVARESAQKLAAEAPKVLARLVELKPDWADTTKFREAFTEMSAHVGKYGIPVAEFQAFIDQRPDIAAAVLAIVHDASQVGKLQAKTVETLKKVRAAPQAASSPGARIPRNPEVRAAQQAKQAWLKSRSRSGTTDERAGAAYFETLA